MLVVSVRLVKLKGLPTVARLAVRLPVILMVRLPRARVSLETTGAWIPQMGSGPRVSLSEVPSGKVTLSEICDPCCDVVPPACRPLGHVFIPCLEKIEVPF